MKAASRTAPAVVSWSDWNKSAQTRCGAVPEARKQINAGAVTDECICFIIYFIYKIYNKTI
jgi:hypothetical protein